MGIGKQLEEYVNQWPGDPLFYNFGKNLYWYRENRLYLFQNGTPLGIIMYSAYSKNKYSLYESNGNGAYQNEVCLGALVKNRYIPNIEKHLPFLLEIL